MPFSVACPKCDYRFRVPDSAAGQRGKCPKCQAVFIAHASPAADEPQPTASTSASKSVTIPKPRVLAALAKVPPKVAAAPAAKVPPVSAAAAPPKSPGKSAPPKAPSEAAPIIQVAPAASESGASSTLYPQRKKSRSNTTAVIVVAGLALVALVAVGGGIAWSMFGDNSDMFAQAGATGAGSGGDKDRSSPKGGASDNPFDVPPEVSGSAANLAASKLAPADAQRVRQAVAQIDIIDNAGGTHRGLGVVVDRRGWVATTFTLVHGASGATVTLSDGRRLEVAGWLGRAPQYNLALLKLAGSERELAELTSLELNTNFSGQPDGALCVGNREGVAPAAFSGVVLTASLPASGRPLLPAPLRDGESIAWLSHDVRIADEADGAPLVDGQGRVVGINTALGPAKKGYAVPAAHLAPLLEQATDTRFAPLAMKEGPRESLPEPAPTTTPADPSGAPLAMFQALHGLLKTAGWRPAGPEDFEGFQQFAFLVTVAHEMLDNGEIGPLQAGRMREVTMAAMDDLKAAEWPNDEGMTRINRLGTSAPAMENPGLYAFGRCVMRPEHFRDKAIDGLPLLAFELIGTDELVIVPAGVGGSEVRLGSTWLILGRKDLKENFPAITLPGAPDARRQATVVRAKFMLGSAD